MDHPITVLAYLGPETMLPMTSVVAGLAGVAMMFGRNSVRWALRLSGLAAIRGRMASRPPEGREVGPEPAAPTRLQESALNWNTR